MSHSHSSQVPAVAEDYFTRRLRLDVTGRNHPVIRQAFHPDRGWQSYPMRKRITASWARKMRREGYTAVQLETHAVIADFNLTELTRRGA